MKHYISFLILPFVALFGSYVSKKVKDGHNILWIFFSSLLTTLVWLLALKTTKFNLAITSLIFDSIMTLVYFLGFLIMGDVLVWYQWLGAILIISGMILVGL